MVSFQTYRARTNHPARTPLLTAAPFLLVLSNPRVCLRALEPEDLGFLARLENDPTLWDAGDTRVPYSRYALQQYIERAAVEDLYSVRQTRFIIGAAPTGAQALGVLDLFDLVPAHRRAAVGIALLPEARGQGMGKAALEILIAYARDILHLHQLHCAVAAGNMASLRLFRGAGFTEIGTRRQWLLTYGGQWEDAVELQCLL